MRFFSGYNIFQIAAHEFGHALGIRHAHDNRALMAPSYAGYVPPHAFRLYETDIEGLNRNL